MQNEKKDTAATQDNGQQRGLLDCTNSYRVFLSDGLSANLTDTPEKEGDDVSFRKGVRELAVDATGADEILAHIGVSPDGKKKAIYLVRVPEDCQMVTKKKP